MLYLFIGQDPFSKDLQLKKIKLQYIPAGTESFNVDILYAKELSLKNFQEKLLSLPVQSKKRLIVIKLAESLKEDVRKFLAGYARKPLDKVILVLDTNSVDRKDSFFPALARYAKVFRFREPLEPDVFALCRSIDANRTQAALKILNRLLANGEKPEMILGGLRYAWERNSSGIKQARRKLNLLLKCDLEIKTGLLRPAFSLEKLVVGLCAFGDLSG